MHDGEDEGRPFTVAPTSDGDQDLGTPNCPDCLMRMEAEDSPSGEPYWACTECGLISLA